MRLERLEARVMATTLGRNVLGILFVNLEEVERVRADLERRREAHPDPHTLCFISVDKKVVSTHEMAAGKWTHFDPPRDRAEFEPIV